MLGAGGGTSSYEEIETTDLILLWGSNAREAHPIFFHHLMKGVRNGARMYAVDPRRTTSAAWADVWLGIDVGSDIALANTIGREIIAAGLVNEEFVAHSTSGYDGYAETVELWTLQRGEAVTGVPADVIRQVAHDYATAETAQICWTLGITEHHNATDNVLALISLALLTGHVGRYGSGLVPIRGQNNVQGGGDMGALPNKLPGFQDVENDEARGKFEALWGRPVPPTNGKHISLMFEAMEAGEIEALYVIGENPAQSEADVGHIVGLLEALEFMVVQDIFMTKTAELADVVLPAAAGWAETAGTVTSSERRVQLVRKALEPPGEAKDDLEIISLLAERMGAGWGMPTAEEAWDELRSLSPMHAGMSYRRLDELGGYPMAVPRRGPSRNPVPPRLAVGGRAPEGACALHTDRLGAAGRRADARVPDPHDHRPSPRLVQHRRPVRRLRRRPMRTGGIIEVSPEDGDAWGLTEGDMVRVSSRRGAIEVPVFFHESLRPGLVFMPFHFPDEADVNQLTIDAWDPKSGTAEFKATAVNIERVG